MKRHISGQARTSRTEANGGATSVRHPIHSLQRTAGNLAVTSLIEMQRQPKPGPATGEKKAPAETSGPKNPTLAAWFNVAVVERVKTAGSLIRTGKRSKAEKELWRSIGDVRKLVDIYDKENPLMGEKLKVVGNQIWVTVHDLDPPKSRGEIADFAEGETVPRLAKLSNELT